MTKLYLDTINGTCS